LRKKSNSTAGGRKMSLIQEALKRQQEEENKGGSSAETGGDSSAPEQPAEQGAPEILPGISAAPPPSSVAPADPVAEPAAPVPPVQPTADEPPAPQAPILAPTPEPEIQESIPEPPPSPEENIATAEGAMSSRVPSVFLQSEKKKKSSLPLVVGIIVIIAILVGGGLFLMKGKSGNEPAGATSTAELLDIDPVSDDAQPTPIAATDPSEASQHAVDSGTTPSAQPATSTAKSIVPEPKPRVLWPSLTLSGVMGKGKKGSAIINGEFLGVGDTIEGVKILSVEEKSVNLSFMGEKQSLKVGNTTM
jgi:hypothetical protein